jgi:hypothetical protein
LLPTNNILLGGSGNNRTMTLTPLPNQSGSSIVTLTVTDPNFGAAQTSFVLNVIPMNEAPMISGIANVSISQEAGTSAIAFTVRDRETPASRLTVTGSSSNTGLVPNQNIVFWGTGTNRALTIHPLANQFGTSTLTVTVSDGTNTVSTSFEARITPDVPVLQIARVLSNLLISWPGNTGGYVLQSRPTFSATGSWTDVPAVPFVVDGRYATIAPAVGAKLYRLRRP